MIRYHNGGSFDNDDDNDDGNDENGDGYDDDDGNDNDDVDIRKTKRCAWWETLPKHQPMSFGKKNSKHICW